MKKNTYKQKKTQVTSHTALTTAEDERKYRQQRAQIEEMHIQPLQKHPFPFVTYLVQAQTGVSYTVEIRSLTDKINSCSCPDFHVNTLGTCKHIERIFYHLSQKEKKKISKFEEIGSPFVEIFLESSENTRVSLAWPKQDTFIPELKKIIEPFFSANNTLLSPPIHGIASIEHTLAGASPEIREKIRISSHLLTWVSNLKRKEANQISREQFLEDVKLGKRSMQMLTVPLYPYQEEGMLHLAFQGRALLADEMGLGKTIQAIAACELLRRLQNIRKVLIISPASLKGEWEEQIAKFTGHQTLIIRGTRAERLETYKKEAFFFLSNYEQIRSDFEEIQKTLAPDVIILDEAQRIKNWQTRTAWAVKQLKSPYAFVLTGTPIENRIDEVYSIMQMVDPAILGPLFKFNREFYKFNEKGKPIGYQNLAELYRKLKPVLLRRLKKDVEEQLPERTVNNFFVAMDDEQVKRYDEYNDRVAKLLYIMKKRPLSVDESKKLQQWLACMRMICDTPYILDENCRICPKLEELKQVLYDIVECNQNKIIIFSEWERMLFLVREFVQKELKMDFAWHTGSVPQQKRLEDIKKFKKDPSCRLFLTTDSGSTGLNLQCANVVINLDLPWNPAKLEQRIARAWRKNQTKAVQVINFVCENSIEHRMLSTLAQKQTLANGVLDGIDNLNEMPLPSARMQILEQLESLIQEKELESQEVITSELPKSDPVTIIKNDAIAHFNDRIHLLELHQNQSSGQKTMFAVVDKLDPIIEPKMQELVQNQDVESFKLELLDQKTYALLQRLAEAGIISINAQTGTSVYHSPEKTRDLQTERERILKETKKFLDDADRKLKMMNLLASGGFLTEALKPAEEALSLGLKGYAALKKGLDKEGESLLEKIQIGHEEPDENQAKLLIECTNQRMQNYSEEMVKFELGR